MITLAALVLFCFVALSPVKAVSSVSEKWSRWRSVLVSRVPRHLTTNWRTTSTQRLRPTISLISISEVIVSMMSTPSGVIPKMDDHLLHLREWRILIAAAQTWRSAMQSHCRLQRGSWIICWRIICKNQNNNRPIRYMHHWLSYETGFTAPDFL